MSAAATVYVATNTVNGHRYVGVTRVSVAKRWTLHTYTAHSRPRTYLHRAIAKYGPEVFALESVASCLSRDEAGAVERAVIQRLAPVYNQTNGGEATKGRRVAPEVYERIRAANTGKKRTPTQNAANAARKRAQFAARPELRERASAHLHAVRGMVDEAKRIAAVKRAHETRVWSDESRAKLSAACMGRRYGQDVIDRMRVSRQKLVRCLESGEVFACCEDAAEKLGISRSSIYKVCVGARPSVKGLTFTYGVAA